MGSPRPLPRRTGEDRHCGGSFGEVPRDSSQRVRLTLGDCILDSHSEVKMGTDGRGWGAEEDPVSPKENLHRTRGETTNSGTGFGPGEDTSPRTGPPGPP